jgi:hypothetical protein
MAMVIGWRWSLDGVGHWMAMVTWMALIIGWRWSPMTNTNAIQVTIVIQRPKPSKDYRHPMTNVIQVTIAIQQRTPSNDEN